jgi:acyl-CoA synthetase (AMP-forming)/AMP-acid ligase II
MTTAGAQLRELAAQSPHVDVIRYEHKNLKLTLQHVDSHADSLASGLLDCGLVPGDVVLSWLPNHFAEQHILQFACSKAGLTLYTLDPSLATKDPEAAKEALAKALELTEANVLVTQEAGDDTNYIRLVEAVIPETRIFNFDDGMPFITPRFPHLRLPIHTGFDYTDKMGMIPLSDMLSPTKNLDGALKGTGKIVDGKTALFGQLEIGQDGVPTKKGKALSNDEVVKSGAWPEFGSILKKEYREVEGVGAIF